jgi:hypothetical protein
MMSIIRRSRDGPQKAPISLPGAAMRFGRALVWVLGAIMAAEAFIASAQSNGHNAAPAASFAGDNRQLVQFPEPMRLHTIANMRDHLLSLQEIDEALARGDFDRASRVAEQRLGMSSLEAHGAAHLAPFMPKAMQEIGTRMHRAASRFAIEAQTASVSDDVRPALAALGAVMQQCVACHAAYRLH